MLSTFTAAIVRETVGSVLSVPFVVVVTAQHDGGMGGMGDMGGMS